jgi:YD repeat-containing protein
VYAIQTQRIVNGQTFNLSYDAEKRLIEVSSTNLSATFTYDGDGKQVQQVHVSLCSVTYSY